MLFVSMSCEQHFILDQHTDLRTGALLVHTVFWLCFLVKTKRNIQRRPDWSIPHLSLAHHHILVMQEAVETIAGVKYQPLKQLKMTQFSGYNQVNTTWTPPFRKHWLGHRTGLRHSNTLRPFRLYLSSSTKVSFLLIPC